jgi:hypothetical protein
MTCPMCDGNGVIITCFDDICCGMNHCIHGDGEEICLECGGEGDIIAEEDEWYYSGQEF